ncbi:MAG: DUF2083 domain-containing protein [Deltaproteobacteria bacterium]|nr:DUF2083 domain-containing protein [Deltaproteobacteria bacterium]
MDALRLGTRVRALRRKEGLTQKQLAERLGISASYLNLIEHDNRPLPAALLLKLAQVLSVDLSSFSDTADDERVVSELLEAFSDPLFDREGLTSHDVRDLAKASPSVAAAVLKLYRAYRSTRGERPTEAESEDEPRSSAPVHLPTEEATDFIQAHKNYFPALEDAAEALWRDGHLDRVELFRGLLRLLEQVHGVRVRIVEVSGMRGALRRYVPERRLLMLSEVLPSRSRDFQVAHQLALFGLSSVIDGLAKDPRLTSDESRRVARVALANYFAAAVVMPYPAFFDAARAVRYDVEILGHRFRAGYEQVCHRLTTLRRPGSEGVPFHFLRVDVAGNISKRFSASGIQFPRFSGICPRWGVFSAFSTPGMLRAQLSKMPDGTTYFCVSRTLAKGGGGYHAPRSLSAIAIGCNVKDAKSLVYADGVDLENLDPAVPVGVTCRTCPRMDCAERVLPPLTHPLEVDENVRGSSFFAPVSDGLHR